MPAKKPVSEDVTPISITVQHRSLAGHTISTEPAAPKEAPSARINHRVLQPLNAAPSQPTPKAVKPTANHSLRPHTTRQPATAHAQDSAEIQTLIDNKQYFLPIDAVARRRSTKVSLLLTLLVIALAAALVNLMLDSGLVVLPVDVPHTNIFN